MEIENNLNIESTSDSSLNNKLLVINCIIIAKPEIISKKSIFTNPIIPIEDIFINNIQILEDDTLEILKEKINSSLDEKINDDFYIMHNGNLHDEKVIIKDIGLKQEQYVTRPSDKDVTPVHKTKSRAGQSNINRMAERLFNPEMGSNAGIPGSVINQLFQSFMQPRAPREDLAAIASQLHRLITPEILAPLLDMGFSDAVCAKALLLNMINVELAAQWLVTNIEHPDFETPLTDGALQSIARNMLVTNPSALDPIMPGSRNQRPPARTTPAAVQQCIDNNTCTYVITGQKFEPQPYYMCYDCGLSDGQGVCQACANVCHVGHRLSERITSDNFFCDCGFARPNLCKCLNNPLPAPIVSSESNVSQSGDVALSVSDSNNINAISNSAPPSIVSEDISNNSNQRILRDTQQRVLLQNIADLLMEIDDGNGNGYDEDDDLNIPNFIPSYVEHNEDGDDEDGDGENEIIFELDHDGNDDDDMDHDEDDHDHDDDDDELSEDEPESNLNFDHNNQNH